MRVLALDTTSAGGSIALVDEADVLAEQRGDPSRSHAERLPGDIVALLASRGASMASVDLFAVATGPGSFTGLRIGIATMQGLAFVTNRRLVGVSALEALAQIAVADAEVAAIVGVWIDAHRREVFSALYKVMDAPAFEAARVDELEPPAVGDPAATLQRWTHLVSMEGATFIGDGAAVYADVIRRALGDASAAILDPPALAGAVGRIAAARARRGETVTPSGIRPLYVRRPDAEIARLSSPAVRKGSGA
jgi:tRNA threonylcarbamoyladenosine biosynthesis protein TsaB